MDCLAALAFGGLSPERKYMREQPKSRDENILSKYMKSQIGTGAVYVTLISLLFLGTNALSAIFVNTEQLLTGYFTTFIMICVLNALNVRTESNDLVSGLNKNKKFLQVFGIIIIVQVIMTYIGGDILRTHGLNLLQWLFVFGFAIAVIPIDIIRKAVIRSKEQR